jgi:AraC family transcriptional regulator
MSIGAGIAKDETEIDQERASIGTRSGWIKATVSGRQADLRTTTRLILSLITTTSSPVSNPVPSPQKRNPASRRGDSPFSEASAWASVGAGWKHLHGSFGHLGYSIEWHDFSTAGELRWAESFHPGSVEICLNLAGRGTVEAREGRLEFAPMTAGFYAQTEASLKGVRAAGERHRFITIELAAGFIRRHFSAAEKDLHPHVQRMLGGAPLDGVSEALRLASEHQELMMSLRQPPVYASAQRLWYHAKALEVAAALFYRPPAAQELFCQRQRRQNQDRVQRVVALLLEHLSEPLSLEEIGRRVGCSHFYLSRIFSQEMGRSIFQHLRELRMKRASELLSEGRLNVTEVALEVGYSSPSHFSATFHETFGCCPGLYPLQTPAQRMTRRDRNK